MSSAAHRVRVAAGRRVFHAHDIRQTRQALDMEAAIGGDAMPARIIRGLT